ncbi:hypothetical protein [Stackebrandtia nassauensis]|uniref:DUF3168 domain-containing protein n=1 Tax=Stackebrandtia nassauensis (strain DSM 44728 / CIP 108903 / NRRL B-16338 / NBRC 102104 / LLR-40K-21) TaxID=446470 RepID=D3Q2E7_STANL|nr:hypothetical protein [Stackebrandtia nassauensis]ADD43880.1 hypothetical protein Snas_4231 [Stackebrandtia nassauensis DSM 44728]
MPLPDPVTAVVDIIRTAIPEAVVGTLVPDQLAEHLPYIHISQTGGPITSASARGGLHREAARLVISVWAAPDPAAARGLARRVLAALLAVRAQRVSGGVLVRTHVEAAPAFLPDDHAPAGVFRYVATVTTHIH